MLSPTQPSILYGLRGMWAGELTVRGAAHDLHSGSYGGAIHNANQALAELLAALNGPDGRVTVPGFYDQVRTLVAAERAAFARVLRRAGNPQRQRHAGGLGGSGIQRNRAHRGATDAQFNGMWGGFTGDSFKTVIPAEARAKLSCRLVPDQDPGQFGAVLAAYLRQLAPPTVTVSLQSFHGARPFIAPLDSPAIQAGARALRRVFGAEPVFTRRRLHPGSHGLPAGAGDAGGLSRLWAARR